MDNLTVYLLRHGETAWNADNNRYCGRTDIPLNEKGMQQAKALGRQLEGLSWSGVYSSPLQRAYTTACLASGREAIRDDRLIEGHFGTWEGKTREEFIRENESLWTNWIMDPVVHRAGGNGETGAEIVRRVDAFFEEMRRRHAGGTIMVVGHNGVNRLYLAHKLGMPLGRYRQLTQENSALTRFTLDTSGTLTLELLNARIR